MRGALRCEARAALATLSNEQAIDLAYYRGLIATEIASMAAISVSTLKSRLRSRPTTLRDTLRHDTDKRNLKPSHRSSNGKCDGRYR